MSADNRKVNLRDLDINSIGSWPRQAQLVFCGFVALLIVALGWWLFVRDKGNELEGLEGQEQTLRADFEKKQGRAANLGPLKQQLAQMEQQLQQMLRQLPSRTEMPDLIVDISQTALATGLENELFEPGPEQRQLGSERELVRGGVAEDGVRHVVVRAEARAGVREHQQRL